MSLFLRAPALVVCSVRACLRGAATLVAATLLAACAPTPPPAASTPPAAGPVISPLPPALVAALDSFRAEGPRGWAFTQTTSGGGKDRVERYNPRLRGAERWTLLSDAGRAPTPDELRRYRDTRPPFDAAANLAGQLDRASAVLVGEDAAAGTATYEFRLRPAGEDDTAAAHMRARFTLHTPTSAIIRVELFNFEPFKPARSLTILEARTTLVYSPPGDGRPALPLEVSMRIRGKRFFVRDFEEYVVSRFTDHEHVAAAAPATSAAPTAP